MTIYKSKSGDCGTFFEIEFSLRRIFCAMLRAFLFQYCVWHAYQIPPRPKTILSMGGSNKFTWEQEKLEQLRERGGYLQLKPPSSLACWYIRPRWYPRPGMISYDVWISNDMYIIVIYTNWSSRCCFISYRLFHVHSSAKSSGIQSQG